ncbi:MAG: DUF86 domain-containing protein [Bacteroidales bacterium]|nr:DUF86 domain-containing protein [Bacteroidales bacterium]
MKKDNSIYIGHIMNGIDKILSYTDKLSEEQFLENDLVQDAVIRNLEIIGEAVKMLSNEFRTEFNNIPWKDIAGMRDILIHEALV